MWKLTESTFEWSILVIIDHGYNLYKYIYFKCINRFLLWDSQMLYLRWLNYQFTNVTICTLIISWTFFSTVVVCSHMTCGNTDLTVEAGKVFVHTVTYTLSSLLGCILTVPHHSLSLSLHAKYFLLTPAGQGRLFQAALRRQGLLEVSPYWGVFPGRYRFELVLEGSLGFPFIVWNTLRDLWMWLSIDRFIDICIKLLFGSFLSGPSTYIWYAYVGCFFVSC